MEIEFYSPLDLYLVRYLYLVRVVLIVAALIYSAIAYKFYSTPDGDLRHYNMRYFAASAVTCWLLVVFYHPVFNDWLHVASFVPTFYNAWRLAVYMLRQYGITPVRRKGG